MPKKDNITGCWVLTQAEFWASEAEREGKSVEEVLAEYHQVLDDEHAKSVAHYSDPAIALEILQKAANEERIQWDENRQWYQAQNQPFDDPCIPFPVNIVEIVKVDVKDSFRESGFSIVAVCECDSGLHTITYNESHWHGSFYEPPDYDRSFYFERYMK